ncbi:hypothetical protein SUNI508_02220 [Seiridium unicorne]|uniref:Uncharacterized protein n=1 Tax=Seiridium unicorne TaxID=138068 RepID=A0ABR2UHU3_9PEZI
MSSSSNSAAGGANETKLHVTVHELEANAVASSIPELVDVQLNAIESRPDSPMPEPIPISPDSFHPNGHTEERPVVPRSSLRIKIPSPLPPVDPMEEDAGLSSARSSWWSLDEQLDEVEPVAPKRFMSSTIGYRVWQDDEVSSPRSSWLDMDYSLVEVEPAFVPLREKASPEWPMSTSNPKTKKASEESSPSDPDCKVEYLTNALGAPRRVTLEGRLKNLSLGLGDDDDNSMGTGRSARLEAWINELIPGLDVDGKTSVASPAVEKTRTPVLVVSPPACALDHAEEKSDQFAEESFDADASVIRCGRLRAGSWEHEEAFERP